MTTRRQQIQKKAREAVAPIVEDMGLDVVDVEFVRREQVQTLCIYLDRSGGITVDDLQNASKAIEKTLEVSDFVEGRYRLEVSSPGIDRPLKSHDDSAKHVGSEVKFRLFSALPGGQRSLTAVVDAVVGDELHVSTAKDNEILRISLENIARATPVIDWQTLLKGPPSSDPKGRRARRSP